MNHTSFAAEPYLPYKRVTTNYAEISSHCLDDCKNRSDNQGHMQVVTL